MATNAYICPSCHLEQDTKDGFCRDCGTQVIALRYCDSCGVKSRGAEDFCRECGTKLPAIVPFKTATPSTATNTNNPPRSTPSAPTAVDSDTPAWLRGNDPVYNPTPAPAPRRNPTPPIATVTRTDDTPEWLRGAEKRPDNNILIPRTTTTNAPVARTTPIPSRSTTSSTSPVLVKRNTAAPTNTTNRNLQALIGLLFAIAGIVAAGNSVIGGLILIVVAMVVGGKPLMDITTGAINRVVDWIWEDPVLRKRMLDE